MASKLSILCTFFLLSMLLSSSPSLAGSSTEDGICNSTQYPSFCKSRLPPNKSGSTIHDNGRHFVHLSLSSAQDFSQLIKSYLTPHSSYSEATIHALQDCQFLADLNVDFLSKTSQTVNFTDSVNSLLADDLQTLSSATLTNQETCFDSLQEVASDSSVRKELLDPLSNGTKVYSISLDLLNRGWVVQAKRGRMLTERKFIFSKILENARKKLSPALVMSLRNKQESSESAIVRKLLQTMGNILVSRRVVVNPNGSGNFKTINDAVAAAPNNTGTSNSYFVIHVVAGVYAEYVSIAKNKQNLMMIGDGVNRTVITGNHSVADGWTTFNSSTFAVAGQGFVATNITFRNTAGAIKNQAVAVRNGADLSTFYRCSFEGYQDTLYTHSMRQFYRECDIYGTVDFIFGNAAAVFQDCNIYPRLPLQGQFNAITAQGRTDPNQNTGTSIHNCSIKAAKDLASGDGTTKTYLGRPWKQYSRTVYMQSFMDSLIDPSGWQEWSGTFALSTLYYAEYNNSGPGSNTSGRVTWPGYHVINATDAANFTVSKFIQGDAWLPATGVPYNGGLL
ncbi:pectinesterase-like [Carya illinoinensis]|uniref:Pectinesterase n=1 Tax=Carya illinoinensis TaxID=32201 RepID=A0A8T1PYW8_CARIL|nr:pectinesterase-like [Carya illinoinensis]KAG6645962.1 hypothetical protein CIPAW_08G159500 [Carya illinoinensis]